LATGDESAKKTAAEARRASYVCRIREGFIIPILAGSTRANSSNGTAYLIELGSNMPSRSLRKPFDGNLRSERDLGLLVVVGKGGEAGQVAV
jgi:hypothetical protein